MVLEPPLKAKVSTVPPPEHVPLVMAPVTVKPTGKVAVQVPVSSFWSSKEMQTVLAVEILRRDIVTALSRVGSLEPPAPTVASAYWLYVNPVALPASVRRKQ